jgi:hypothetical protein
MELRLTDGRRMTVPLAFYPTLRRATPAQRARWEFLGEGIGFTWDEFDLQLAVDDIVAGRREHIPSTSFYQWLRRRAAQERRRPAG